MKGLDLDLVRRAVLEATYAVWPYSALQLRDETATAIADRVIDQLSDPEARARIRAAILGQPGGEE